MFSPTSSAGNDGTIPHGTLAKASFKLQELKTAETGTRYARGEAIIEEGDHTGRHVFANIMDPFHEANSPGAKEMGLRELCRACECAGLFNPASPETYNQFKDITSLLEALNGKSVSIVVEIEKGTGSHPDRNVFKFLTPNPIGGRAYEQYRKLHGDSGQPMSNPASEPVASTGVKNPW